MFCFVLKKFRKIDQHAERYRTEKVTGQGRRTRQEIAKWNQMTALTPDGGDVGKKPDIPGLPSGDTERKILG